MTTRSHLGFVRLTPSFGLAVVLCSFSPQVGVAQVCIGNPTLPGQFSIEGNISFSDGATGYGAGVTANLDGPFSIGGSVGIVDLDDANTNIKTVAVNGAYALNTEGFGVCPVAGVGYATWSDTFDGFDVDLSSLSFPLGLGVGVELGNGGSATLIPSASAGLFYHRLRLSISDGFDRFTETDTETDFFFSGGATLVLSQFFVRASVLATTVDDSDAVFQILVVIRL
jgi:hypothetical protein